MPYVNEFARGESLWRLVESPSVQHFKGQIREQAVSHEHHLPNQIEPSRGVNSIARVIAIDGSNITHRVENGYPGAEAALLNLAAVVIKLEALRDIPRDYIPSPREMREMEQCRTLSAVLPGRNIIRKDVADDSPKRFFRHTVQQELGARLDPDHESLLETFKAVTKSRTDDAPIMCPIDDCPLEGANKQLKPAKSAVCNCSKREHLYETDALRAHERFEENGSSEQAFTAVRECIEHLTLVNILRYFERTDSLGVFRDTAFIMDGPLAIFGMSAWLKVYIEREIARLHEKALQQGGPGLLVMGIEKSGQFINHLIEMDWLTGEGPNQRLKNSIALAPNKNYIHEHIVLRPIEAKPYGESTYYGRKILYKNKTGQHSVVMTPIVNDQGRDYDCTTEEAYPRIGDALDIMDELATYLYQDGFAPLVRAHAHAAIPLRAGARILENLFSR